MYLWIVPSKPKSIIFFIYAGSDDAEKCVALPHAICPVTDLLLLVNVKWGKQVFKDVEVHTDKPIDEFKVQLYSLSSVPPERQKGKDCVM